MFVSVIRQAVLTANQNACARSPVTVQFLRSFRSNARSADANISQKRVSLRDKLFQPATETPFTIGKGALIGGSAFGIGALCYYGLGMSNEAGIIEKSYLWSQRVRDRISTTYMYFGGSILMTAAGAAATLRSPVLLNIIARPGIMGLVVSMAAVIGTSMVTRSIEYREGFGPKQISWLIHSAVMGTFIAPICLMGGPIVARAALYTAGIFGGLSTIAVCAPSEKFLMMGGPLAMGMGFVFVSSLASCFIAPTTAIGAGLYSVSMYGGLLLFSGFLLYDTQRVVKQAEYEMMHYDPVNQSMSIYMDTLNIFIRLVMIMSGMNGNRRK